MTRFSKFSSITSIIVISSILTLNLTACGKKDSDAADEDTTLLDTAKETTGTLVEGTTKTVKKTVHGATKIVTSTAEGVKGTSSDIAGEIISEPAPSKDPGHKGTSELKGAIVEGTTKTVKKTVHGTTKIVTSTAEGVKGTSSDIAGEIISEPAQSIDPSHRGSSELKGAVVEGTTKTVKKTVHGATEIVTSTAEGVKETSSGIAGEVISEPSLTDDSTTEASDPKR